MPNPLAFLRDAVSMHFSKSVSLIHGYYVCFASEDRTIFKEGITLSPDGMIHLFGKLSCALAMKEKLEREQTVSVSIWRADISGLCCTLDPEGENISSQCLQPIIARDEDDPINVNEFCHGYTIAVCIGQDRLVGMINYC